MAKHKSATVTRWHRLHSGGLVEEIVESRPDWFEAAIASKDGVRRLAGRAPTFDIAELLACRQLHLVEHRRCSSSCQFDWSVEQIPSSALGDELP